MASPGQLQPAIATAASSTYPGNQPGSLNSTINGTQQQHHQQQNQLGVQHGNGNSNGNGNAFSSQAGPWGLPPGLDREKLSAMTQRMAQLRSAGLTEQSSPELAAISNTLITIQRQMARMKQMQMMQQQQQQQHQQQNMQELPQGAFQGQPTYPANQSHNQVPMPMPMPMPMQQQGQPLHDLPPMMNGHHQPGQASMLLQPHIPIQTQNQNQQQQHTLQATNGFSSNNMTNGTPLDHPSPTSKRPPGSNGVATTTIKNENPSPIAPTSASATFNAESHVILTPQQMASFKAQIYALRFLQKGLPIPPAVASVIFSNGNGSGDAPSPTSAKIEIETVTPTSASANQSTTVSALDLPMDRSTPPLSTQGSLVVQPDFFTEPEIEVEELPPTLIAPYNAFRHPRQVLASLRANTQDEPYKTASLPSLLPAGLDPHTLQVERNRFIEARIAQRKKELEALPSILGDGSSVSPDQLEALSDMQKRELLASQKLKALIELKSLNLLQKQKQLREDVVRGLNQAVSLNLVTDRNAYRATRKITLKDARMVDQLERQQKIDRENRAKQKHLDQLMAIAKHGKALDEAHSAHKARQLRLGRNIMRWHVEAEKEEQKRIERVSKERLKALRNNDEEAYMKLIDTAKDTRITHLLRQTDTFLDSLSQAVAAQQAEAIDRDPMAVDRGNADEETITDEATFGAAPVFEDEPAEKNKVDYYNVAHRIKESVTAQPKILSGGTLKEYQLKGLQWMISLYNNRLNGILADEMGLGKTIQTISLITYLIEEKQQHGPFLCIVPLSTLGNWQMEFAKWAPGVTVTCYKGSPIIRKNVQNRMRSEPWQVLLTTYEYIIKDRPFLARYKWIHMIIDEGHRMKNTQSKLSQSLTQYYNSRYRLILTGTPLQNNLPELWALLNFVLPKVFNSQKSFDEWFNTPFANTGGQDKIDLNEEEALLVIRRLHKVLRPFLLRRLKKDVESELPDKVERLIRCKMSALQIKLYKHMKEHGMIVTHDGKSGSNKAGMKGLQNTIMQLRKICNHPFVFPDVETMMNPSGEINQLLYRTAGKFELLDRILPKLFRMGHRVLMFFQMTEIMNIMEDYLRLRNTTFLRLDGSTKPDERSDMLKEFNHPDSTIPIFLLSTRAGGLGLNLQTADTVIIYDSDWNPHQDLQAQDRAHRIGQKKEVRIFRLVTEKSIEEHILARAREKLEIDKKVIQGGRFDNKSSAAEREDFLRAILEVNEEDDEDTADLGDEELNDILVRGNEEGEIFTRMDLERTRNEELAWIRAGNRTPLPERLITDAELPDVYHRPELLLPAAVEVSDQRRKKAHINYDDGMTEEQWTAAIEDDSMGLDEHIARNRRRQLSLLDEEVYSGSEGMARGNTQEWESEAGSPGVPGVKKRKRPAVSGSRATSVDTGSINEDVKIVAKRRKTSKQSLAEDPERARLKDIMEACFDAVEDVDNEEMGHQCAGLFYKLPSKRDYPEYYIVIPRPICMDQIKKKMNSWKYESLDEYIEDFKLLFNNARTFNDETSVVYKDADSMQAVFESKIGEYTSSARASTGQQSSASSLSGVPKAKRILDSDDE